MKIASLLFALALAVSPASADSHFKQFTRGKPVTLEQGTAYLLIRGIAEDSAMTKTLGPVLVRALGEDEIRIANETRDKDGNYTVEPNVVAVDGDDEYVKSGEEWTYLVAVRPGTYIIVGEGFGGQPPVSLCLGTLKFDAKPGIITDLGYVLWRAVRDDTTVPELQGPIPPRDADPDSAAPLRVTVRPYKDGMSVPATLANLPSVPAAYGVVASFPNYFQTKIDRMVPVPGLLDYDANGRAVDLRAEPGNAPGQVSQK